VRDAIVLDRAVDRYWTRGASDIQARASIVVVIAAAPPATKRVKFLSDFVTSK
jgi:hypothetical protein